MAAQRAIVKPSITDRTLASRRTKDAKVFVARARAASCEAPCSMNLPSRRAGGRRQLTDVQPHDLDVGDESGDAYRIGIRRREDQETGEGEPQISFESKGSVGLVSRTAIMSDSSNGPFG
jgi:hypothetical protein